MLEGGMLDISMADGGKLVYCDLYNDELSRYLCHISDTEDLTSEADWMVDLEALASILKMSDTDVIEYCYEKAPEKPSYRVADIRSFVVSDGDRAVVLFSRDDNGKFVPGKLYIGGGTEHQQYWETMYPDPYERAVAKTRAEFFPDDYSFWYFVGEGSGRLYRVTPRLVITCDDESYPASWLRDFGIEDGLNPEEFFEWSRRHRYAHFSPKALKGTGYARQKLVTPEAILASALTSSEVRHYLVDVAGYQILDDTESNIEIFEQAAANLKN